MAAGLLVSSDFARFVEGSPSVVASGRGRLRIEELGVSSLGMDGQRVVGRKMERQKVD